MYKKGHGLGLSIAQNIVKLHKGNIFVESEIGKGSSFVISIPKGNSHFSADEILQSTNQTFQNTIHTDIEDDFDVAENDLLAHLVEDKNKKYTIVYAEDNQDLGMFVNDVLSNYFNVYYERNGLKAYKRVFKVEPDIIISDVVMPIMDGYEFCTKIKNNIETNHIPFIILTSQTSQNDKFEGLELGADDFLCKPFHVKELLLKCNNIITTQNRFKDSFLKGSLPHIKNQHPSVDGELFKKAIAIIEQNLTNELFDVPAFCNLLGVSRTVLFNKIKLWTDTSPNELIVSMRMKHAAKLIEQEKYNFDEIAKIVCYKNQRYFSRVFKKYHGISPSQYAAKFTL